MGYVRMVGSFEERIITCVTDYYDFLRGLGCSVFILKFYIANTQILILLHMPLILVLNFQNVTVFGLFLGPSVYA